MWSRMYNRYIDTSTPTPQFCQYKNMITANELFFNSILLKNLVKKFSLQANNNKVNLLRS